MVGHKLPTFPTPFVGRTAEIAELSHLLDDPDCRLLTLVGPGGIGKTRLAIEVARCKLGDFADGVYFVPLQPLESADHIVTALLDALPLHLIDDAEPRSLLLDYLRKKHVLLLLDNFEHLLDGVDVLTDILNAAAQIKLLVTSRERLNLRAEQVWPLQGLDVPEEVLDSSVLPSAAELFDECARRVQPDFLLKEHIGAVADICRSVAGMPLALELAACWVHAISCKAIAGAIQHNIDMLASRQRDMPERHQSMRAVFDHSWTLLSENERAVFRRLSVFRDGFSEEAAQQVAGASLQILVSLIDKSLLQMDSDGRYDLHELLRQYAEEQLKVAGETETTLDKHSKYFLSLMKDWEVDLKGPQQNEALDHMEAALENLRAAWQRAVRSHADHLVDLAVESLFLFCILRSRSQDHKTLFGQAREEFAPRGQDEPTTTWGRILARSYRVLPFTIAKPQPEAITNSRIALRIARTHGDHRETAFCLHVLGILTLSDGSAQAMALLEESLQHYVALSEVFYRAYLLQGISECHYRLGQIELYPK